MPRAKNGNVTIHYEDQGTGQPVLLIHGHTSDRRAWEAVTPALLGRGLRVLTPDLRGHGLSTRPDSGYHASHHAADMAAVLDAAGVDAAGIVGHSIGGAVALELVLTMPERVDSLVLISPVMPDRPFEDAFMENLRDVARVARSEGIEAAMRGPWVASPLFEFSFSKPGVREAAMAINRDFPGAEYLATERDRVERSWTVPERLAEISIPTAVVAGDHETAGFRAYAEEAGRSIPNARLEFYENCGHLAPIEEPDRVAEVIVATVQLGF